MSYYCTYIGINSITSDWTRLVSGTLTKVRPNVTSSIASSGCVGRILVSINPKDWIFNPVILHFCRHDSFEEYLLDFGPWWHGGEWKRDRACGHNKRETYSGTCFWFLCFGTRPMLVVGMCHELPPTHIYKLNFFRLSVAKSEFLVHR